MVAPCPPSGNYRRVQDGSRYHGALAATEMKTAEGWLLVRLVEHDNMLYLLLPGEYGPLFYTRWY